jgi:hypothetical protein
VHCKETEKMKRKMVGIIMMSAGGLLFVFGTMIYKSSGKVVGENSSNNELDILIEMAIADGVLTENEKNKIRELSEKHNLNQEEQIQRAELKLQELNIDSETELIDYAKKNGNDFEKHIIQRFNKKYFKTKNWAGDKYVNGHYAETTPQPDIIFEFILKGEVTELAVECKWRKKLYKNGVEFANEKQFDKYKQFERTKNMPVFIAVGLGGTGIAPENVYIIPLRELRSNFIDLKELDKYKKVGKKNFYFLAETLELN